MKWYSVQTENRELVNGLRALCLQDGSPYEIRPLPGGRSNVAMLLDKHQARALRRWLILQQ